MTGLPQFDLFGDPIPDDTPCKKQEKQDQP